MSRSPESPAPLRFVDADATEAVLDWKQVIGRLRDAYAQPLKEENAPPRSLARGDGVWLRALAAVPPSSKYMGTKVFGLSRNHSVNYLISLFDQQTGALAALIDGYHITALRTAATSAVALECLIPRGRSVSVAVLGSGVEAHGHVRALASIRTISSLKVFSPTPGKREAFAQEFSRELGAACSAAPDGRSAVEGADVVIAAARSRDETPTLYGAWLAPRAVVVSIGSTLKEQREIDTSVVEACDIIVCDHVHEVANETGDMVAARAAGIDFDAKMISLNEVLSGRAAARLSGAQRPMFKSVGSALQDVIVAELAFERAVEKGLAIALSAKFRTKQV